MIGKYLQFTATEGTISVIDVIHSLANKNKQQPTVFPLNKTGGGIAAKCYLKSSRFRNHNILASRVYQANFLSFLTICVCLHFAFAFRWKFVIYGAIDGFSRKIMYLSCNTNNKAATVLEEFLGAVKKHGLTSRIRGDMGVENADITWYMFTHPQRGPDRGSFISGKSVHNQKTVGRCVLRGCIHILQFIFPFRKKLTC